MIIPLLYDNCVNKQFARQCFTKNCIRLQLASAIALKIKSQCNVIEQVNFRSHIVCSYRANNLVSVMFAVIN